MRISLAEVICKIASCFDTKGIISSIVPLISTLLKDESLDTRLMVLKNISILNKMLDNDDIKKYILPLFQNIHVEK